MEEIDEQPGVREQIEARYGKKTNKEYAFLQFQIYTRQLLRLYFPSKYVKSGEYEYEVCTIPGKESSVLVAWTTSSRTDKSRKTYILTPEEKQVMEKVFRRMEVSNRDRNSSSP